MTDSLRDQLLGLGFKPAPKPERKPDRKPEQRRSPSGGEGQRDRLPADARATRPGHTGRPPHANPVHARPAHASGKPRSREDIDLAKAYAIRAQREKDERIETERLKQEQARERREAKARVAELLKGKALNSPDAEIARHFNYGGKIKRVHVTAEQLRSLNSGALGVVQMDGRYVLIDAALLTQAEAIFPQCVALKVDPDAPSADDPYADPQYQVPDDIVW
jgi:uncharacterized protein YaiL (DUF2058 family)